METFQPEVLGSEASWTDIAQADWGYAVLGQTTEGGTTWAQTMKLEVGPTPSLGPSSPFELGPASGSYTGARAIAADGDVVSVLTSVDLHDGYVEYYRSDGSALSHYAWADYTGNRISPGRIVLDGERTFMCGGDRIEFAQPGEPHRHVEIDGGYSERPLRLSSGQWFVPTTSTTTTTPLYLFDAEELTVEQVGETTTGAYLDPGGAFHAALYDGELFLAQITRGLVRTPWTPPDIYAYGPGGSATSALWTRGLGTPGPVGLTRIERIDDVLLGLGPQGEGFGDAPPIGLLRICPQ